MATGSWKPTTENEESLGKINLDGTYLLEVGASGEDFVDKIFDRKDVDFAEGLFDDGVVGEGNALLVHLSIAPLVDQFPHRLEVGFTVTYQGMARGRY